jgi:hypothetical protein
MVACFIVFYFFLAEKKGGVVRASSGNLHQGITWHFLYLSFDSLSLSAVNYIKRYAVLYLPSHDS